MTFLWTKRKKMDIVAWGLGEDCSHFGIQWSNNMVSHWTVGGYKYEHVSLFLEKRYIVHEKEYDLNYRHEVAVIGNLNRKERPKYDWSYVFGLALHAFNRVVFSIPIPQEGSNIVDSQTASICHEAIEEYNRYIVEIAPAKVIHVDPEKANTPHRLYKELGGA